VDAVSATTRSLLASLRTDAPTRNRAEMAAKARARAVLRFSR
jgi:hypothetical protein